MGAAEFVKARLECAATDAQQPVSNRGVVASVLQRPDEPGEFLAYWTSRYGRSLPKPVKRGTADAVRRLYNGKALLKYDTAGKGYRFGDVLNLVHAAPAADKPWQGSLFSYALDRRHHPDTARPPELGGGTDTPAALRATFQGHDRVVITTDEQAGSRDSVDGAIPAQVPMYTWNLAGYRPGHAPSGGRGRHTFGGLTDQAFRMIPLLEAGVDDAWPWQQQSEQAGLAQ